jgi:tetratricopeptide (TPR) repeat protein
MIKSNSNKTRILLVQLLFLFMICGSLFAQDKKDIDNRIKEGTLLMYKNPDEAIRIGNKIVEDAKGNVDYKIRAYKLISDAYSSKRDYQKSLEYVIKASQILNLSKDALLKIIITNKMGIQYHQLKIYDKSIQYLDQAEQLMLDYPVKDSVLYYLGSNNTVRGFIYKEKLNCDLAIDFFDKGFKYLLESKSKLSNSIISINRYNKGNCYIQMSNYTAAKKNFEISIKYAINVNASSLHAFALKGLAQVYTLEGKFQDAVTTLQKARSISENVEDLILNQEIYKGLSENYLALNQWKKYKEYHFKYLTTQKLIKERERKSISDSLVEKKSELNAKLDTAISNFYLVYVLIFIVITLVILFVIHRIKVTKKEIEDLQNQITLLQNPKSV